MNFSDYPSIYEVFPHMSEPTICENYREDKEVSILFVIILVYLQLVMLTSYCTLIE